MDRFSAARNAIISVGLVLFTPTIACAQGPVGTLSHDFSAASRGASTAGREAHSLSGTSSTNHAYSSPSAGSSHSHVTPQNNWIEGYGSVNTTKPPQAEHVVSSNRELPSAPSTKSPVSENARSTEIVNKGNQRQTSHGVNAESNSSKSQRVDALNQSSKSKAKWIDNDYKLPTSKSPNTNEGTKFSQIARDRPKEHEPLARQMKSAEQLSEINAGKGTSVAGAGSGKILRDRERLARQYGGKADDWSKVTSSNSHTHNLKTPKGTNFEVHAYENKKIRKVVEPKTKIEEN